MNLDDQVKFDFDRNFQEQLAALILTDRPFCEQIFEVLDINFFEFNYLKTFVSLVRYYKEEYNQHPSLKTTLSLIAAEKNRIPEEVRPELQEFFIKIHNREFKKDSQDYVKKISLDFCKKQRLRDAMLESVDKLDTCSFDDISDIINGALKLGLDNNHGHDYHKDFNSRYVVKARNPIPTWPLIDVITRGGLGSGELGVVIAPTGAGKSMALVHLGAQALKKGLNVVHYTLELQDTTIGLRYDSCITGYNLKDLFEKKKDVLQVVDKINGRLTIKEYPTKSASSATIMAHLDKLTKMGEKVDLVIVDYGDLLKLVRIHKERRNELENTYEELRAIGQTYNCPVWTASQTNRKGLGEQVVGMDSISEAFSKCFVADLILSISRTKEDRNSNHARMYVAKNRNGPDGLEYPMFMDTSNIDLQVLTPQTDSVVTLPQEKLTEINKNLRAKKAEKEITQNG